MSSHKNNKTIVDLNKVQFATLIWRNQFGDVRTKPADYTTRNVPYNPTQKAFGTNQTLDDLAIALKIKDVWTAELRLQLTANHSIIYTGKKALSIYDAWCAKIFRN